MQRSTRQVSSMPPAGLRVGVVVSRWQFDQRQFVGDVAVDLVGAHQDEHGLGGVPARGFQQVERARGVDVEVIERAVLGQVVRGLSGAVDDQVGSGVGDDAVHRCAVADVERVVFEARAGLLEPSKVPVGIATGAEEVGPHIVIDSEDVCLPRSK